MQPTSLLQEVAKIFVDGGGLMIPLAILTVIIYYCVVGLYVDLSSRRFAKIDENMWRHWIDRPDEGTGELGEIIRFASKNQDSIAKLRSSFAMIRSDYIPNYNTRIRFSMVLISTAPLGGLLGTVTGMLTTFDGLAASAGASTASLVAGGIAEALITTMVGLVIAIPGYIMISQIKIMKDSLELFFLRLENSFIKKNLRHA